MKFDNSIEGTPPAGRPIHKMSEHGVQWYCLYLRYNGWTSAQCPESSAIPTAPTLKLKVATIEVDGVVFETIQTISTHRSNSGQQLTKTMFATSNQINSSTIDVTVVPSYVHLYSGAWSPSPLDPPMSGTIPSIASGACYHSACHGFAAAASPIKPPTSNTVTNGSFLLEPSKGSGMMGYIGVAFAQVGQGFIIEISKPVYPGNRSQQLGAEAWGVEVGDTMVYTLVLTES